MLHCGKYYLKMTEKDVKTIMMMQKMHNFIIFIILHNINVLHIEAVVPHNLRNERISPETL